MNLVATQGTTRKLYDDAGLGVIVEGDRVIRTGVTTNSIAARGYWTPVTTTKPTLFQRALAFIKRYNRTQRRAPKGAVGGGRFVGRDYVAQMLAQKERIARQRAQPDGTGATSVGAFERSDPIRRQLMQEILGLSIPDRRAKFEGKDAERVRLLDELADATHSINRRIVDLVPDAGDWSQDGKDFGAAALARTKRWAEQGVIPEDMAEPLARFTTALHGDLIAAGVEPAAAVRLARRATDALAAQEAESNGRSLGDHGVRHLTTDYEMAMEALKALPGTEETDPGNRAMLRLAAAFHDTGYLTPASRVFLDNRHPEWSRQYYDAHLLRDVQRALGPERAAQLGEIISTHADADFDFRTPASRLASTFRLGDNLALFHTEKLPAMMRYVPANVKVLERLGRADLTVEAARKEMLGHLERANLNPRLKQRIARAIGEVSPVLPKLSLGMYGGRYNKMTYENGGLRVWIQRTQSSFLHRIADLGFRQFKKLYETYNPKDEEGASKVAQGTGFDITDRRSKSRVRFTFSVPSRQGA